MHEFSLVKLEVSIHDLLSQPVTVDTPEPATWVSIDHDLESRPQSKLFVNKDGIPLVLHMPKFMPAHSHVNIF